jgi:small subunit ribosomal protein S8
MPVTDPIADMLTRVRNALMVQHPVVQMPSSKTKLALTNILMREGYISDFEVVKTKPQNVLRLRLRYADDKAPAITGLKRVSKPGLRIHVQRNEVPRFYGGVGISIMSTSHGIMTGQEAWRKGVGGELMCYVW